MTAHIDRITVMPRTDWQPPRAFVTVADDQRPGFSLTDMVTLPDSSLNSYNMAQAPRLPVVPQGQRPARRAAVGLPGRSRHRGHHRLGRGAHVNAEPTPSLLGDEADRQPADPKTDWGPHPRRRTPWAAGRSAG